MNLEGKVVVVTGGASGIGAAIATLSARRAARVAICGRNQATLDARARSLRDEGLDVVVATCDVRDPDQVGRFVETVRSSLGPIDVLVNNAGGWAGEPLFEIEEGRLLEVLDTTVRGTLLMSRAVLSDMIPRKSGFILNVGSTSGLVGARDSVAAAGPKAAITAITAALRTELRTHSVGVAILHPAWVASKSHIELGIEDLRAADGEFRALSAMQVAEAAIFMLSQPPNVLVRDVVIAPLHADI